MATQTEIKGAIKTALEIGTTVAPLLVPQYAAFATIGAAVAAVMPEIYEDVVKLLSKADPTPEDQAALRHTIQTLLNPENLYKA